MADDIRSIITDEAKRAGVDPSLALSLAHQESGFDPNATSPTGVRGLFQVTNATGAKYGQTEATRTDPRVSARAGIGYLSDLLKQHKGDVNKSLMSYNGGTDPTFDSHVLRFVADHDKELGITRTTPLGIYNPEYAPNVSYRHLPGTGVVGTPGIRTTTPTYDEELRSEIYKNDPKNMIIKMGLLGLGATDENMKPGGTHADLADKARDPKWRDQMYEATLNDARRLNPTLGPNSSARDYFETLNNALKPKPQLPTEAEQKPARNWWMTTTDNSVYGAGMGAGEAARSLLMGLVQGIPRFTEMQWEAGSTINDFIRRGMNALPDILQPDYIRNLSPEDRAVLAQREKEHYANWDKSAHQMFENVYKSIEDVAGGEPRTSSGLIIQGFAREMPTWAALMWVTPELGVGKLAHIAKGTAMFAADRALTGKTEQQNMMDLAGRVAGVIDPNDKNTVSQKLLRYMDGEGDDDSLRRFFKERGIQAAQGTTEGLVMEMTIGMLFKARTDRKTAKAEAVRQATETKAAAEKTAAEEAAKAAETAKTEADTKQAAINQRDAQLAAEEAQRAEVGRNYQIEQDRLRREAALREQQAAEQPPTPQPPAPEVDTSARTARQQELYQKSAEASARAQEVDQQRVEQAMNPEVRNPNPRQAEQVPTTDNTDARAARQQELYRQSEAINQAAKASDQARVEAVKTPLHDAIKAEPQTPERDTLLKVGEAKTEEEAVAAVDEYASKNGITHEEALTKLEEKAAEVEKKVEPTPKPAEGTTPQQQVTDVRGNIESLLATIPDSARKQELIKAVQANLDKGRTLSPEALEDYWLGGKNTLSMEFKMKYRGLNTQYEKAFEVAKKAEKEAGTAPAEPASSKSFDVKRFDEAQLRERWRGYFSDLPEGLRKEVEQAILKKKALPADDKVLTLVMDEGGSPEGIAALLKKYHEAAAKYREERTAYIQSRKEKQ